MSPVLHIAASLGDPTLAARHEVLVFRILSLQSDKLANVAENYFRF